MRFELSLPALFRRAKIILALFLILPFAVPAQADIVTIGAPVFDPEGNPVGTVVHIEGELATIDTGSAKVTLTLWSFAMRSKGLIVAMSRAELEANAARLQARDERAIMTLLKPGAPMHGPDGEVAAVVDHVDGRTAVFRIAGGEVRLDISAFKPDAKRLESRYDRAALEELVKQKDPRKEPPRGEI